jgi:2-polyprenyl-6-methoxyphenol hydroxylase-like FAD-dependent oxidoreductase
MRHHYGLGLWQNRIEKIMADWVAELPVTLHRGCEVTGFTQDDTGVDVALADGRTLRAKYLVGCDGGRSLVRKNAGIEFAGWDASTSWLIADVEMTGEPAFGIRRGEKGVNAIGKRDDGKIGVVLVEREAAHKEEPSLSELHDALVAVYGTDFGLTGASFISRFTDMARQAKAYRDRRVLLAGDAAHVHAPSGGQGLNTGVQDAVNLGWKLAQVVKGTSPDSLLDTYHAERHPIAARVLRLTMAMTALGRGDDRTEALRDVVADVLKMDEPRKRYGAILSGLDIRYDCGDGHPLVGRRMPDVDGRIFPLLHDARPLFLGPFDIGPWADRVRKVELEYDGPWELPEIGRVSAPKAVLVRPDGYVAWASEASDDGLREALKRWFGDR